MDNHYADTCNLSIADMDEHFMRCSVIGLLPSGPVWDDQRNAYFKKPIDSNNSSLVHFAAFLGSLTHFYSSEIVNKAIRELNPSTAIDTLEDWLSAYNWNYRNINFDFSPDGLFEHKIILENGRKKRVRTDRDLSKYSRAIKSQISTILYQAKNIPAIFNVENLNRLFEGLGVKIIYSKTKPKQKNIFLFNNLYAIINPEVKVILDPVTNSKLRIDADIGIDLKQLLLEISFKLFIMIFNEYNITPNINKG